MKKVAVITGTRAEYGLLKPLLKQIEAHEELDMQLFVTAMHLSPEFGLTVNEIEKDGFKIDKRIECILSSDTASGISKSVGLALIGFADAFQELEPDLVIILGDRSEMLAAATAAMIANIPIGHIHGGDTTEGAYDEAIRHAITKMSYWHFPSTEIYRRRIVQLGESPERVFNVGAISIDAIQNLKLLSRNELEEAIDFKLGKKNILITYHPVTLENDSAEEQFQIILESLENLVDTHFIFTFSNSDKGGRIINDMIKDYVSKNRDKSVAFKSLGHLRFLSALKYMDAVVGNSSSGIVEVPYFHVPTINIGDRQKGRVSPKSVLNTACAVTEIDKALKKAFDKSFLDEIKTQEQVYGSGNTTAKIMDVIVKPATSGIKKKFYDIKFQL